MISPLIIILVMILSSGSSFAADACRDVSARSREPGYDRWIRTKYPSCADFLDQVCRSPYLVREGETVDKLLCRERISNSGWNVQTCSGNSSSPIGSLGKSLAELFGQSDGGIEDNRRKIVESALKNWKTINDKRLGDLNQIVDLYRREGLNSRVSLGDLKQMLKTMQSHINDVVKDEKDTYLRENVVKFIADQFADAFPDQDVFWYENGQKKTDTLLGIESRLIWKPGREKPARLSSQATPDQRRQAEEDRRMKDGDRFRYLLERAQMSDDGQADLNYGNITPYHAKLILLYNAVGKVQEKYRDNPGEADRVLNELARGLELKALVPSKTNEPLWKTFIPHDGFVFGAYPSQIRTLIAGPDQGKVKTTFGAGADCSTFIQRSLDLATGCFSDYGAKGRLTSEGIVKGQLKEVASLEPLDRSSARRVSPGDLLIARDEDDPIGHTVIIVGYSSDSPPGLLAVSAEGGYQRTVVLRKIDLFPNAPSDCEGKPRVKYGESDKRSWHRASFDKELKCRQ